MPIYAFACRACGHHFDRLQKLSDPDPATCPECGASQVARQVTAPSFRLAGSGWYETDFKGATEKKHNLAGNAAAPAASTDHGASPSAEGAKANASGGAAKAPASQGSTATST